MMSSMFHRRRLRDTFGTVALGVAVAAGSATVISLYLVKRKQTATRRATFQCSCGKVKGEIYQPAANYKYMETTNMQCCCHDCVGYCKAVLQAGSAEEQYRNSFFDPGVSMLFLYDSEILIRRGEEYLEHMKLSMKTESRRVFSKCCGTPIAVCPDHSHLNMVYCPIIHPNTTTTKDCEEATEVPFPATVLKQPTICLFASRLDKIPEDDVKLKHPHMTIVPTVFAPRAICRMVGRLLFLMGMGGRGPGQGFPVADGKSVGFGYEAISNLMAKA